MLQEKIKNNKNVFIGLMMATLIGLLFSRALLSIINIVWLLFAIVLFKKQAFFANKNVFYWALFPVGLFFLGAWQPNFSWQNFDYLLTLLVYPIVFLCFIFLPEKITEQLKVVWIIIASASCFIPVYFFFKNYNEATGIYSLGRVVFTPMDTDHVRYTLVLASAFLLVFASKILSKQQKILLAAWLFFILVVLAVRTGWVALIVICLMLLMLQLKNSFITTAFYLLALMILCISSYFIFPQVKNKIHYNLYDWQLNKMQYNPQYSDAARFAVNKIAYNIIAENKNVNVGWHNIPAALENEFNKIYPDKKLIYHWPFNQYLFWYLGSGWWGLLLFLGWLFYIVALSVKQKRYFLIIWQLVIMLSCLVECNLSLQYGVFLHAFVTTLLLNQSEVNCRQ